MNMTPEMREKLIQDGRADLVEIYNINRSGYTGILPNGNIVDRRKHPLAIAIPANKLLGIPEPKPIPPPDVSTNS